MTTVRYDDREFVEAVNLLGEMLLRLADMTPVAESAGELLEEDTREAIAAGTSPDGAALAPLAPSTLEIYRKQDKRAPTLLGGLDGGLAASLSHETKALTAVVVSEHRAAGALLAGTNKAQVFGKGRTVLPARPFLSAQIREETGTAIENNALDYILGGWENG